MILTDEIAYTVLDASILIPFDSLRKEYITIMDETTMRRQV